MQKLIFVMIAIVAFRLVGFCQQENVFKLTIVSNNINIKTYQQTAFKVEGKDGLVTALHGVVNARLITATSITDGLIYSDLRITQIDIAHDIAVVSSTEIKNLDLVGFKVGSSNSDLISGKELRMRGYYYDANEQENITVVASEKPFVFLKNIIKGEQREILNSRRSPELGSIVLWMNGNIIPGNSGAPILMDGKVIAIANGGLEAGTVGRCWGIPITYLQNCVLHEPLTQKYIELEKHQKQYPFLFAYEPVLGLTVAEKKFCQILDTMRFSVYNNFEDIIGKNIGDGDIYTQYSTKKEIPGSYYSVINLSSDIGGNRTGCLQVYFLYDSISNEDYYDFNDFRSNDFEENVMYRHAHANYILVKKLLDNSLLNRGFTDVYIFKSRNILTDNSGTDPSTDKINSSYWKLNNVYEKKEPFEIVKYYNSITRELVLLRMYHSLEHIYIDMLIWKTIN